MGLTADFIGKMHSTPKNQYLCMGEQLNVPYLSNLVVKPV
jgi:hypothetical protein